MEIVSIPVNHDCSEYPLIKKFKKSYADLGGISYTSILTGSSEAYPGHTPFICIRMFIQETLLTKERQKYIVALRSHHFGSVVTLDVISLDQEHHMDIAFAHCERMSPEVIPNQYSSRLKATQMVPFAFTGGYVEQNEAQDLCFGGESDEYSNDLYGANCNEIARYLADSYNIDAEGDIQEGSLFMKELLELMVKHKGSRRFYEQWVTDHMNRLSRKGSHQLHTQQTNALKLMLTYDRCAEEKGNLLQLLIEETSSGISNNYFNQSVKLRINQEV